MSERRTDDATLIAAVRILSRTITTEDGVIPACLAEAAARLAEFVEERRWVPVGERLPEKYQRVIVAFTPDSRGVIEVCEAVHNFGSDFETDKGCYECSHWQPLPPGPEANG